MVPSRPASPNRRSSSSASINARIVPFISHYYSLLGDSPISLIDLHAFDPEPRLKWQIPSHVIGGNPRIQGSALLDNGILTIRGLGKNTLFTIFSSLPTISCKIPVEIIDVNETTESIATVSVHGHIISGDERLLFFQVLEIHHGLNSRDHDSFLISNNIFYVYPAPLDLRSLQSISNHQHTVPEPHPPPPPLEIRDEPRTDCDPTKDHTLTDCTDAVPSQDVKTFPTYQDAKKTAKAKPQIKIHGLSATSGLSDKDILSAISFQLKSNNEGFAIAINRNKNEVIVQVDSVQSQDLLAQRGIYIQGLKYKVSSLGKKPSSGAKAGKKPTPKTNSQARDAPPAPKKTNNQRKEVADKDGWITVSSRGKNKTKTC